MNKFLVIRIDKNNIETNMLTYMLLFSSIAYYLNVTIQLGFHISFSVSAIFYGIALLIGVGLYLKALLNTNAMSLLVFVVFAFGTLLFCLFNNEYIGEIYTNIFDIAYNPTIILFMYCIPVLFLCLNGNINFDLLFHRMLAISIVNLFLYIIGFLAFGISTTETVSTYMTFSYYSIPATCICLAADSENRTLNIITKLLAGLGIMITFIGGSRGALVCDITFVCILVFFSERTSKKLKFFLVVSLILVTTLVYFNFSSIVRAIGVLLNNRGLYSRTVSRLADASFFVSDDRSHIWTMAIDAAKEAPLTGYGMWGDRAIVQVGYAHNIFVEFICSYGFFFGIIISMLLVGSIVVGLRKKGKVNEKLFTLFLIAIPTGFVQLLLSGSYLTNIWFFFLIGTMISIKRNERIQCCLGQ